MKKFKDPIEYALSKENVERTRKDIRARFYRERWFFGGDDRRHSQRMALPQTQRAVVAAKTGVR